MSHAIWENVGREDVSFEGTEFKEEETLLLKKLMAGFPKNSLSDFTFDKLDKYQVDNLNRLFGNMSLNDMRDAGLSDEEAERMRSIHHGLYY